MERHFIGLSILMFFLSTLPGYAGAPLDTVQTNVNKVLDVARDPKLKGESAKRIKKEKLEAIYEQMFDGVELSMRTLGKNWIKINPAQQQEFIQLYRQILEKAYIDKILSYTNEKIVFSKENMLSNNQAEIQTNVITSSKEIPIFYKVILKDGIWKVYDVVVENVSLVQNYRSQFNSILAKNTPDQLLEILRKKVKGQ
ncbi:MAG: toluene tolerance protein, putative toluene tolerance protein [Deltaproteobacteria bacterium CSP1-8]|nr:MAG: toluene tolerance protein, putative toluene tolerance protein [Deltaproteobacteria bacterium CSP1-8]